MEASQADIRDAIACNTFDKEWSLVVNGKDIPADKIINVCKENGSKLYRVLKLCSFLSPCKII